MDQNTKGLLIKGGAVAAVLFVGWLLFRGGDAAADLDDPSLEKRIRAIEALEKEDTDEAAKKLAPYATRTGSADDLAVSRRALAALGRMRRADSQTLVAAMSHAATEIREAAVAAAGTRRDPATLDALRERVRSDKSTDVRLAALAQLGAMRDWDSMPLIIAALDDKDETIVNVAIRCALDIGGREHAGFKPGATPQMRAEAIRSLKRDWQSFKGLNEEYERYRKIMNK